MKTEYLDIAERAHARASESVERIELIQSA
jgi:hypothetical protein